MFCALLLTVVLQDAIDKHIQDLGSADIAARDAASDELKKLTLEQLPRLLPAIESSDAEVRSRGKEIANAVLRTALGERKVRFECAPVATESVYAAWDKAGADPAKPPEGYRCLPCNEGVSAGESHLEKRTHVLVETAAVLTNEDIRKAAVAINNTSAWQVDFTMTEEGGARFDAAAARLYKQQPKGMMALSVDGRVLTMPRIMADKFGGSGIIAGGFTKEQAEEKMGILLGRWTRLDFQASGKKPFPVDAFTEAVRSCAGMEKVSVEETAAGARVTSTVDARTCDLVALWLAARKAGWTMAPTK